MQRLPLQVEQLGQLFVAAVGVFDPFGQLALVALDHPLLFADLLGLLLDRVLALVEQAFAFVQLLAELAQLAFSVGLLLDGRLFHFEFGFALVIARVKLGLVEDSFGVAFRIFAAEAIQHLDEDERQHGGRDRRDGNANGFWHSIPFFRRPTLRMASRGPHSSSDGRQK